VKNRVRVPRGSESTSQPINRRAIATVALNRALSKLGLLSRSQATGAIRAGRVKVDGRVISDPAHPVTPERARIEIDGQRRGRPPWRTILFHKPRGVVTTRRDPEGRKTVYDVLGESTRGLVTIGRLDLATSGVLLLTTDTTLSHWLTSPEHAIPRTYVITVRGEVTRAALERLEHCRETMTIGTAQLRPIAVTVRKSSRRETHLMVELYEGKNREIRRLFAAIGHGVTRLKRVGFGPLTLGDLQPGRWRDVSQDEMRRAFPDAKIRSLLI
jgi:23S rRNA pseudouridine2605 synthase